MGVLFGLAVALFLSLGPRATSLSEQPRSPNPPAAMPATASSAQPAAQPSDQPAAQLLSDPFLQSPTPSSVRVVWFTDFEGTGHTLSYGETGQETSIAASSTQLSRTREDDKSQVAGVTYERVTRRPIWRHEAEVTGLTPGQRLPYQVFSTKETGELIKSRSFTLSAAPPAGQPLKILLTSDHQLMPMTAANLQKVAETVDQIDAVFIAGDLVNVPDRASEWFDDARGGAFFPVLQGRANYALEKDGTTTTYQGAEIIQNAPLFPAVGNHEVMGRYSNMLPLGEQFNDSVPWAAAKQVYEQNTKLINPKNETDLQRRWLKNNSFNIDTYEEIFSLPKVQRADGGETQRYYATTFGDVRLISLYVTQIWRVPNLSPTAKSRYREKASDGDKPRDWGYGQHIFEGIYKGSPQYQWLEKELASDAFQQAKYKIVMLHHPPHTLGGNIVPAFTNPVRVVDRNPDGSIQAVRYEYPKDQDYIIRDLMPLLERAGVQLVFYGHSHIWNRFQGASGLHFLEASNVGNTYGAHVEGNPRQVPQLQESELATYKEEYVAIGDPNGLEPIVPTIAPLMDEAERPMPYVASNDITVFSVFETGTGTVSSYYFDTREPASAVVKFDQFRLGEAG
ncbi:MAG: metallophosphoesterase family protein [Leptolyngbya sp. SIO4C1]|nr:metallophosphoesterase family protein [Leptolyngbya sp. SIO4C1]